jgi:hypothetical protein
MKRACVGFAGCSTAANNSNARFFAKLVQATPIANHAARRIVLALKPLQELLHLIVQHIGDY